MNYFDHEIIIYLNQFSQRSGGFDALVGILSANHLAKGGVLAMVLWWAWFQTGTNHARNREKILATLGSCAFGFGLARALALTLPFRLRPRVNPELPFKLPTGEDPAMLDTWSSFPSDHAVLFYALSTGLFFISKRVGIGAFVYTSIMIAMPRIYLGLHYPTDIVAGAAVGVTVAAVSILCLKENRVLRAAANWSDQKPALFYPLFFLLTYQIADMFDSGKALLRAAKMLVAGLMG